MNYYEFMRVVEKRLSSMSEEEKTKWIYNKARTAKEHERKGILNSLEGILDDAPIIYEKDKIEQWCEKIEEGEIYFECSGYEAYGESYWDSDFVYDYFDPFKIKDHLYKTFQMAEKLLFQKRYEESRELYERLLNLSYSVLDRDADDWNEFDFEEVVDEIWTEYNYEWVILNLL